MAIREILRKLTSQTEEEREEQLRKITPDETELAWYKRREYLANVKRELDKYRKQDRDGVWKGKSLNDEHQIIKAKNVFRNEKRLF